MNLISASVTGNTNSVYRNAVLSYNNFAVEYGWSLEWPISIQRMVLYISYLFERGYAPSSITTYVAGISFYHKVNNWSDPSDAFVVTKLLEGCRRSRKRMDVRAPITESILTKLVVALSQICFSTYEAILFKAAFTLAYFGLFRVGELVYTTEQYSNRPLLRSDIMLEDSLRAVRVTIRCSKANQRGPPDTLRIPDSNITDICCVKAINEFMKIRPVNDGLFFCHLNKSPLTRNQFCAVLSKAVRYLGLPVSQYKSHSFRIGRATMLSQQGIDSEKIKILGRWQSRAYAGYIRL